MGEHLPDTQGEERVREMQETCTFLPRLADGGRGSWLALYSTVYDEGAISVALLPSTLYRL